MSCPAPVWVLHFHHTMTHELVEDLWNPIPLCSDFCTCPSCECWNQDRMDPKGQQVEGSHITGDPGRRCRCSWQDPLLEALVRQNAQTLHSEAAHSMNIQWLWDSLLWRLNLSLDKQKFTELIYSTLSLFFFSSHVGNEIVHQGPALLYLHLISPRKLEDIVELMSRQWEL